MTWTLHVTIEPTDHNDLEERLEAIDAGEDVAPSNSTLSSEDLETFWAYSRLIELIHCFSVEGLPKLVLTSCTRSGCSSNIIRNLGLNQQKRALQACVG